MHAPRIGTHPSTPEAAALTLFSCPTRRSKRREPSQYFEGLRSLVRPDPPSAAIAAASPARSARYCTLSALLTRSIDPAAAGAVAVLSHHRPNPVHRHLRRPLRHRHRRLRRRPRHLRPDPLHHRPFAEMARAQSDIRARLISSNIALILRTGYRDAYRHVLSHIQFRVLRPAQEAPPGAVLKTAEK